MKQIMKKPLFFSKDRPDLCQKIEQVFFNGAIISIQWGIEGMRLVNGLPVIGDRAGPDCRVWNLLHEMSHFVEIDDERMCLDGWGLKLRKIWVFDRMCIEPLTSQPTEREIRVLAYQRNVMNYLGMEEPTHETVSSLEYMPDFQHIPLEDGSFPYDKDGKVTDLSYDEIEKSRLRWIVNKVEAQQKKYTFDRFMDEWLRKNELLLTRQRNNNAI